MGTRDILHPYFKILTTKKIRQHAWLYYLNGIAPSPNMWHNFFLAKSDAENSNDLVNQCMPNGVRRHEYFKWFFIINDPRIHLPPKIVQPKFKVDTLFEHVNTLYLEACGPSTYLEVDEQIQMFTGHGSTTRRWNFKHEGNGFFMDWFCDNSWTIACCPRN